MKSTNCIVYAQISKAMKSRQHFAVDCSRYLYFLDDKPKPSTSCTKCCTYFIFM